MTKVQVEMNFGSAEVNLEPLKNTFYSTNFTNFPYFCHFQATLTSALMISVIRRAEVMFTEQEYRLKWVLEVP